MYSTKCSKKYSKLKNNYNNKKINKVKNVFRALYLRLEDRVIKINLIKMT